MILTTHFADLCFHEGKFFACFPFYFLFGRFDNVLAVELTYCNKFFWLRGIYFFETLYFGTISSREQILNFAVRSNT